MDQLARDLPLGGGAVPPVRHRHPALPDESPLEMPVQSLRQPARQRDGRVPGPLPSSPPHMGWRRLLVLGTAVLLTGIGTHEMYLVLSVNGLTPLAVGIMVLFVVLFAWIALALVSAVCGFVSLLGGGGRRLDPAGSALPVLSTRTALLMPTYNEAPARVASALQVIHEELDRLGALSQFDVFILSDTTDPDIWIAEEAAFLDLRDATGGHGRIFYRRRAKNTERKAGNIGDWVRRFGGAYEQMLVLDADSVMEGETLIRLAGVMERNPDVGLVQTLPIIANGETLLARMQQFAGRVYGPLIAHGIAWWHGAEGNYWGHNAVIRTRAFADAAGLPELKGRYPFGGHILSHDFVEAALLRRAGWGVHMMPALAGSFEEGPPSLTDLAVRDRRWCQGNLQHMAVLFARGLHPISRLHLLMGIGSYVTAPLWLLFLIVGVLISLQSRFTVPVYFPAGPTLFPHWPVVDPIRSMWVFIATLGVLLLPKLLSFLALVLNPAERRAAGGGIAVLLGMLVETVVAGLIAPVTMLTQSAAVVTILAGRDGGWRAQRRDAGSLPLRQVARDYLPHTLIGVAMGLVSYMVSPPLAAWMLPVVLGLALAIPLVAVTARRGAGRALRRVGLLLTAEEVSRPAVLARASELQASRQDGVTDGLRRVLADPVLLDLHLATLPPPRRRGQDPFDAALLVGTAKLREADTLDQAVAQLTAPEKLAVLGNAEALHLAECLPGRPL